MSGRKDGGPAFGHGNHEQGGCEGMSLRDWFAGQAMAGLSANPELTDRNYAEMAEYAYSQADALLAARATDAELAERSKP